MPAQVLVMCAACGRPQFAGKDKLCEACSAPLPEAPAPGGKPEGGRERLLSLYEPFLEASVGPGRRLLLSRKHLEWHDRQKPALSLELAKLAKIELTRRPAFEALLLALATGLGAALVPWLLAKAVLLLLTALAILACFVQRRMGLVLHAADGKRLELFWTVGTPKAPSTQRMNSVWNSLKGELEQLHVATREGP